MVVPWLPVLITSNFMEGNYRIVVAVILGTGVLLALIVTMALLLILNNSRRIRHRAELAEADRLRDQEVMRAEREATQQTLREVGKELHDNVAQLLSVAQLGIGNVLNTPAPDVRLVAARDALDRGVEEVRRLGHDLNSDRWQYRSLVDAIGAEAERLERVGRLRAHVRVVGGHQPLLPETSIVLYRAFQEVVNNALKHSRADTLTFTVEGAPFPTLTISDNGRGFNSAKLASPGGLQGVKHRCTLVGYEATCVSSLGHGCTWTFKPQMKNGT